jgi:hypothetical protein
MACPDIAYVERRTAEGLTKNDEMADPAPEEERPASS